MNKFCSPHFVHNEKTCNFIKLQVHWCTRRGSNSQRRRRKPKFYPVRLRMHNILSFVLQRHRFIRQGVYSGVDFFAVVCFCRKSKQKPQYIGDFSQNSRNGFSRRRLLLYPSELRVRFIIVCVFTRV